MRSLSFLFALLVTLTFSTFSIALEKTGTTAVSASAPIAQAKTPVTLQAGEYELLNLIFEFAPGKGVPSHMHGGKVLVQVLSGEITLHEKGGTRIVKAGESWSEEPGDEHYVTNDGSVPVKVAVSMILPKGAEPTTFIRK